LFYYYLLCLVYPTPDLSGFKITVDESQKEIRQALLKANKLKERKADQWDMNMITRSLKREPLEETEGMEEDPLKSSIILNATAEFCRTLGDIPTYGMAGNRDEDEDELMVIHCMNVFFVFCFDFN
jgi:U4/U6.U5 tri-snRNP-associated protein 1